MPVPATVAASLHRQWSALGRMSLNTFPSTASRPDVAASVFSPGFSGVAMVDLANGELNPIRRFTNARVDQAGGGYDGRYVVWKDYHSLDGLDDYAVFMWDSTTGIVSRVGGAHRSPQGHVYPSPWADPVVSGGYAAWVEGLDDRGLGEVVLLRLADHRRSVVRTGHPTSVALYDGRLVWGESMKPGALTVAKAVDLGTLRPATVPPALRHERGGSSFASSGGAVAWVGADSASVYYAPSPGAVPHRVFTMRSGGLNPPLSMRGALITSTTTAGTTVIDARTRAAYTLANAFGVSMTGDAVVFMAPNPGKQARSTAPPAVVTLSEAAPTPCG